VPQKITARTTPPKPSPKGRAYPTHKPFDGKWIGKVSPCGGDLEGVDLVRVKM